MPILPINGRRRTKQSLPASVLQFRVGGPKSVHHHGKEINNPDTGGRTAATVSHNCLLISCLWLSSRVL